MRYTVVDLENFDQLQEGRIPLAKKATLVWIGFTGQGVSATYRRDLADDVGSGNVRF